MAESGLLNKTKALKGKAKAVEAGTYMLKIIGVQPRGVLIWKAKAHIERNLDRHAKNNKEFLQIYMAAKKLYPP